MKSWTWSYFVTVSLSGLSFKIDVNSERKLSFQCNFCFAVKLFSVLLRSNCNKLGTVFRLYLLLLTLKHLDSEKHKAL